MKEKMIAGIIMLAGGAVASICCVINRFSLTETLKIVLLVMLIFLIVGLIADKIISNINQEVRLKEEAEMKEITEREAREEAERVEEQLRAAAKTDEDISEEGMATEDK